ncbi:glycoside hydrolase family 5 protein [Aquimarina gracilis]|uniref:Glycoside hydrolase family 5 protein n=1 Tax=Aquimarina gracilis TaxID=874422 RepID=A0ABU5ZRJ8_9FLAO|nr:glycoside hydrolase family 5 protein [Aquimarina gracilis]MEB3344695.1 glycoside hydrolase family 5 protein [Aquimarina gracilis]
MRLLSTFFIFVLSISLLSACESDSDAPGPSTDEQGEDNSGGDGNNGDGSTDTPTTAVANFGLLKTSGNKIVDKNNNPIQLRGMSLFWSQWMGQYYTKEAVSWLKEDWKCNIVRAAMGVEDADGYLSNKDFEKQKVFTVIDAAIEEGIYVIVDWHSHHAEDHVEEAKTFFAEVAQKYGDKANLIYEIYNEPLNVPWNDVLKPYHEQVITAIRQHDPDNLIICGTRTWSQDVDEVIGNEINDNNVAYTLHYYASTHKQFLRDKAQKALDAGIPLFVTEYGVTEASGDGFIDTDEARVWWGFLDQNNISWCNWSIADKREASAALNPGASGQGGWTEDEITTSGKMVRDEIKTKNP